MFCFDEGSKRQWKGFELGLLLSESMRSTNLDKPHAHECAYSANFCIYLVQEVGQMTALIDVHDHK